MKFDGKVITKKNFLLAFAAVVAVLFLIKCIFPDIALPRLGNNDKTPVAFVKPETKDSIDIQCAYVDSLLLRPLPRLRLIGNDGKPVKNRITSVVRFETSFPDLNDVQLATARRTGISLIADRDEAARRKDELVFIDDCPYYNVKTLHHSIPYLVPRASVLLNRISRAFIDSLASKGLPFHKIVVTSVLRTEKDIEKLRNINRNASTQSCHRFGTTFDISYNKFVRIQDPDSIQKRNSDPVKLKSILAEVLEDQRLMGTCYVKYERLQSCFHITAR